MLIKGKMYPTSRAPARSTLTPGVGANSVSGRASAQPGIPIARVSKVQGEDQSISRRIALALGLVFIFLRVSFLHEVITEVYGFNSYVLYLCGIPAILLTV